MGVVCGRFELLLAVSLTVSGVGMGCAASEPAPAAATPAAPASADAARAGKVEALLGSGRDFASQGRAHEAELQLQSALKLAWGFGHDRVFRKRHGNDRKRPSRSALRQPEVRSRQRPCRPDQGQ